MGYKVKNPFAIPQVGYFLACLMLTACGGGAYYGGPPAVYAPSTTTAPSVREKRKVGKPYKIMDKWYTPLASSEGYRQKGIASWYGKEFHGKKTANGEIYDMHAFTAAHTTLPLPTYVRVTNLENGRHIKVKVNDRGPFLRGRLIDMSYAGAQALGFAETGTAPVLVEAYPTNGAPLTVASVDIPKNNKVKTNNYSGSFTNRASKKNTVETAPTVSTKNTPSALGYVPIYIQTGSFGNKDNAERQKSALTKLYNNTQVAEAQVNGRTFYRVRIGPLQTVDIADQVLAKLIYEGYKEAIVVIDD